MSPSLQTESRVRRIAFQQDAVQSASEARLASNSHLLNRNLFCTFHAGTLVLHGRVRCYYHKQIAQTVVADIEGVAQVINQIEVDDSL